MLGNYATAVYERVVDLTEPEATQFYRSRSRRQERQSLYGTAEAVGRIADRLRWKPRGKTVKMARSLDPPLALLSGNGRKGRSDCGGADRDDYDWLKAEGLEGSSIPLHQDVPRTTWWSCN